MRALSTGEEQVLADYAARSRLVGRREAEIATLVAELRRRFEEAIEKEEAEDERDRIEGREGPPDHLFSR